MAKKFIIAYALIVSMIIDLGISGAFYGHIIEERKYSNTPFLVILIITIICSYLLKLL